MSSDMSDISSESSLHILFLFGTCNIVEQENNIMLKKFLMCFPLYFPTDAVSVMRTSSWCFREKVLIQSLYKLLAAAAIVCPRCRWFPSVRLLSAAVAYCYVVLLNTGSTGTT
uniref:Uncharacterized protein n=1 Tax=Oryza punctata TaxID=4537 RepID=A0A0E0LT61_ORYPU